MQKPRPRSRIPTPGRPPRRRLRREHRAGPLARHLAAAAVLTCGALGLTACGSDRREPPTVAATTGVLADVVREVAGERVTVAQIVPDGSSPHDFQLSARDRRQVEEAALVVCVGEGLEAGLDLEQGDTPKFTLADHVGDLRRLGDTKRGREGTGAADPHVWMDPVRVARALPALARRLAEVDPGGADLYRKRATAYARRLMRLDAEIERTLRPLPPARRKLVTSHDSMGYFAQRYGLEVIGTAFPASGPDPEPSAARLERLIDTVRTAQVPALFVQTEDDPKVLRRIADETGVEVVDELLVGTVGETGSYENMLRHDGQLIAAALGK